MLVRSPDLLLCWRGSKLLVRNLKDQRSALVSPEVISLLDFFDRPRSPEEIARKWQAYEGKSVLRLVARLEKLGFLLSAKDAWRANSRLRSWKENVASAYYHVASRDLRYLQSPAAVDAFLRRRLASERRPAPFRRYLGRRRIRLAKERSPSRGALPLNRVLDSRRTVREFRLVSVSFEDLSAIVRGTWGMTGWLEAPPLGHLPAKRSPSAGSLHPIECYLFAWRVSGLKPGLYHYDVAGDDLRRLRSGDFRNEAVRIASGQSWVRRAGFLCVMTAVFGRTLWKYDQENAYRVVWMDAGHLGQTFCLLATALSLGPFTTAAIQDSYVEKLLGIDGINEFPVYLCGAGVPAAGATRGFLPRQ